MLTKTYVALSDNVLVKEDKRDRKIGVLAVPSTVDSDFTFGTVISVGEGTFKNGTYVPNNVFVGDEVVFPKTSGATVNFTGEELILITCSDIIAVKKDTEIIVEDKED